MLTISNATAEVLAMPTKSRAILADLLLDSLNDVDTQNYDKIWIDEAQRRDKEMSDNKPVCKSHEEVMQRAKEELMCR